MSYEIGQKVFIINNNHKTPATIQDIVEFVNGTYVIYMLLDETNNIVPFFNRKGDKINFIVEDELILKWVPKHSFNCHK